MIKSGILNPHLLDLLARVRHTNTLVIADRGFPYWPGIETVDISLVDNIPTVLDVLRALAPNFKIGGIYDFPTRSNNSISRRQHHRCGSQPRGRQRPGRGLRDDGRIQNAGAAPRARAHLSQ